MHTTLLLAGILVQLYASPAIIVVHDVDIRSFDGVELAATYYDPGQTEIHRDGLRQSEDLGQQLENDSETMESTVEEMATVVEELSTNIRAIAKNVEMQASGVIESNTAIQQMASPKDAVHEPN